jgi:hypothetical protein
LALPVYSAPPPQLLPANLGAWAAAGPEAPVSNPGPDLTPGILQEYGIGSITGRSYARGGDALAGTAYLAKDPSGAYGLYSYLRDAGCVRVDITEHSCISGSHALVLDGNAVLTFAGKNLHGLESDLKITIAAINSRVQHGPFPVLYAHLPQTGFEPGSDRYILGPVAMHQFLPVADGDWAGFAGGAEAEVGKYISRRGGDHEITLVVVDYPTPQVALKKIDDWKTIFNVNGAGANGNAPVIYAKRSLTLVTIVYGARNEHEAEALMNNVQPGTELTWNEPGFNFTDPNMGSVIVGVIYGTGILCMFALIAGLAFGGFRIVIKRLLPGRVFDRKNQMDVLQLGLGSKPINSQDFYGFGKAKTP